MITKIQIGTFLKRTDVIVATASVLSFAGGAVSSFFFTKKRLENDFDAKFEEEREEVKDYYKKYYGGLLKTGEFETPESAAKFLVGESVEEENEFAAQPETLADATKALDSYFGEEVVEVTETVTVEERVLPSKAKNVFEKGDVTPFNYDYEVPRRTLRRPYVIAKEEFLADESGFQQSTLTWFDDDEVLIDEQEKPIDRPDDLVGSDNLTQFGYGSGDRNVVYIRNPHYEIDFEIILDRSSYKEKILGILPDRELRHSHMRRSRRDDDG